MTVHSPQIVARRAFTAVELLVVIGIIVVLASLLMAGLSKAREQANALRCESNLRSLMSGMLAFATDHDQHMPGTLHIATTDTNPEHGDWLMGGWGSPNFGNAPQAGTIYKYVNNPDVYRCPSEQANGKGVFAETNGRFDYAYFTIWCGALLHSIPNTCTVTLLTGQTSAWPTPIICHEDSYQQNGSNIEGDHGNVDQITHIHSGGGYYAAADGSVNWIIEPDKLNSWSNGCWQWNTTTPKGKPITLAGAPAGAGSNDDFYWNQWSQQ